MGKVFLEGRAFRKLFVIGDNSTKIYQYDNNNPLS
jgi:hypothetical protein